MNDLKQELITKIESGDYGLNTVVGIYIDKATAQEKKRIEKPLTIILDFVERWNKNDEAIDVAHAVQDLEDIINQ